MASALETFCGQAYGAEQYHMLGIYLQRALVVLNVTCIPLSVLFFFMENLLLLCGQTAEISAKTGEYALWLLPALYAYAFLQPFIKFLQTQSVVLPMVVCSAISLAVHVALCWLIVHQLGMGFRGAALATSISFWVNVILLFLYVRATNVCEETWGAGLSMEAFTDLKSFVRLAASSAVMIW
jgi:MATE family multidrug resistance protein